MYCPVLEVCPIHFYRRDAFAVHLKKAVRLLHPTWPLHLV